MTDYQLKHTILLEMQEIISKPVSEDFSARLRVVNIALRRLMRNHAIQFLQQKGTDNTSSHATPNASNLCIDMFYLVLERLVFGDITKIAEMPVNEFIFMCSTTDFDTKYINIGRKTTFLLSNHISHDIKVAVYETLSFCFDQTYNYFILTHQRIISNIIQNVTKTIKIILDSLAPKSVERTIFETMTKKIQLLVTQSEDKLQQAVAIADKSVQMLGNIIQGVSSIAAGGEIDVKWIDIHGIYDIATSCITLKDQLKQEKIAKLCEEIVELTHKICEANHTKERDAQFDAFVTSNASIAENDLDSQELANVIFRTVVFLIRKNYVQRWNLNLLTIQTLIHTHLSKLLGYKYSMADGDNPSKVSHRSRRSKNQPLSECQLIILQCFLELQNISKLYVSDLDDPCGIHILTTQFIMYTQTHHSNDYDKAILLTNREDKIYRDERTLFNNIEFDPIKKFENAYRGQSIKGKKASDWWTEDPLLLSNTVPLDIYLHYRDQEAPTNIAEIVTEITGSSTTSDHFYFFFGGPGMGKSCLTRKLYYELLEKIQSNNIQYKWIFYLQLRKIVPLKTKATDDEKIQAAQEFYFANVHSGIVDPENEIYSEFELSILRWYFAGNTAKILWLADGLDELARIHLGAADQYPIQDLLEQPHLFLTSRLQEDYTKSRKHTNTWRAGGFSPQSIFQFIKNYTQAMSSPIITANNISNILHKDGKPKYDFCKVPIFLELITAHLIERMTENKEIKLHLLLHELINMCIDELIRREKLKRNDATVFVKLDDLSVFVLQRIAFYSLFPSKNYLRNSFNEFGTFEYLTMNHNNEVRRLIQNDDDDSPTTNLTRAHKDTIINKLLECGYISFSNRKVSKLRHHELADSSISFNHALIQSYFCAKYIHLHMQYIDSTKCDDNVKIFIEGKLEFKNLIENQDIFIFLSFLLKTEDGAINPNFKKLLNLLTKDICALNSPDNYLTLQNLMLICWVTNGCSSLADAEMYSIKFGLLYIAFEYHSNLKNYILKQRTTTFGITDLPSESLGILFNSMKDEIKIICHKWYNDHKTNSS